MGKLISKPNDEEDDLEVSGGTFTQEAVNSIVRDRLQRQKATLTAQFNAQLAENKDAAEQVKALQEKADKYDVIFKSQLSDRRKKLPESVTQLLDKLEPAEQLTWLDENADKIVPVAPEQGPQTPKPQGSAPDAVATAAKGHKAANKMYGSL